MGFINDLCERFALNAYALGRNDRAISWLRRLETREGESTRVLRNLGVALLAAGETDEAERYLLREEELHGETYQRHRALADLYYCAGKREKALGRYAAAIETTGATDDGCAQGLRREEREFLRRRKAICADPRLFESSAEASRLFARGEIARDGGNPDEALELFLKSGELDETSWPAFNNAGVLTLAAGDATRAFELFNRAYAYSPLPTIKDNVEAARAAIPANA